MCENWRVVGVVSPRTEWKLCASANVSDLRAKHNVRRLTIAIKTSSSWSNFSRLTDSFEVCCSLQWGWILPPFGLSSGWFDERNCKFVSTSVYESVYESACFDKYYFLYFSARGGRINISVLSNYPAGWNKMLWKFDYWAESNWLNGNSSYRGLIVSMTEFPVWTLLFSDSRKFSNTSTELFFPCAQMRNVTVRFARKYTSQMLGKAIFGVS